MEARATKQVDTILAKHKAEPLPADVQAAIRNIVEREQEWINHQ